MELKSAPCRFAAVVAFIAVGGLVATPVTHAEVTRTGTYLEVGNGGVGEMHPDVAYSNKSNAYLVVWGDGGGGSRRPAYAQLVSSAGSLVGARLELTSCSGELYGQRPRVAYTTGTSDDVFVVLYREWCGGAVNLFAHAVRYSANGAVSVARASVRATGSAGGIVYNAQRRELVAVWEEYGGATTQFDSYGRVLGLTRDGNGVVTGFAPFAPAFPVADYANTQGRPRIALDPGSQSYLIAFQGENPTTGALALMYRTLDAASGALSGLLYAAQGSYNVESSVVYLPQAGEFLITWRQGTDIVGRRFAPVTGAPTSSTYPLLATPGTDGAAGASYDAAGSAGMVAGMNTDYTVWASEFTSTGAFVSTFQASTAPPTPPGGGTFFPQVTSTGNGGLALTYGLDYKSVYIERFSAAGGGGGAPPPPPPPPAPLSVTSLTADRTFPIALGTSVTLTATATGGTGPYTYRFMTYNASTGWSVTQDYSALNTLTYFPAAGTNVVQVWVRNAGSNATYDAWKGTDFFTVTSPSVAITAFTVSRGSPITPGSTTVWTATGNGPSTLEYQFWLWNGNNGVWSVAQDYSTLNSFTWTPGVPDVGPHYVQVWARTVGSSASYQDWKASPYFIVSSMTGATLTTNPSGTARVGQALVFTGTGQGGSGNYEYRFWRYTEGSGWTLAQDYGPYNTFTWYPTAGAHAVQVWVRQTGSTTVLEAYQSTGLFSVVP